MLKTGEFWQYANEAMFSASCAETDDERRSFIDLARTWTQAAIVERRLPAYRDSPCTLH